MDVWRQFMKLAPGMIHLVIIHSVIENLQSMLHLTNMRLKKIA